MKFFLSILLTFFIMLGFENSYSHIPNSDDDKDEIELMIKEFNSKNIHIETRKISNLEGKAREFGIWLLLNYLELEEWSCNKYEKFKSFVCDKLSKIRHKKNNN